MSKKTNNSGNRNPNGIQAALAAVADFFALVGKKIRNGLRFYKVDGNDDPEATSKHVKNTTKVAIMLAILILILIIILIHIRGCRRDLSPGSINIPGNIIDVPGRPRADIKFGDISTEEGLEFGASEMRGGDSEIGIYRIVIEHNSDFVLKYTMTIRDDEVFKKLAEVLMIKVELLGENGETVMYDGLLSEMKVLSLGLEADGNTVTECVFRVTVYLEENLPSGYYGKDLVADMSWWIEGQDHMTIANCEFGTASVETPPGPGNPDDPDDPDNPDGPDDPDDPENPDDPDDPDNPDDPDIPDGPSDEPNLKFNKIEDGDNSAFDIENLKNGESEVRYFSFSIDGTGEVIVQVDCSVAMDSGLGEALYVKVELVGENGNKVLYEGLLEDLLAEHKVVLDSDGETDLRYKVTITANGLTDEHHGDKLICDLSWSLVGTSEQLKIPNNSIEAHDPSEPGGSGGGSGSDDPPKPPHTATIIELTQKEGYDNTPFVLGDMLPGGSEEEYYCISVTNNDPKTVRFGISVDPTQKLSKILRVKVEQLIPDDKDILLYDGLMKECVAVDVNVAANSVTSTQIYYRVTVYTNGAEVTNEYAGESLSAEFWWRLQ